MRLKVENMSCQHCVNAVTRALRALDAKAVVEVDLGKGEVRASGDFSTEAAIATLNAADYPAKLIEG
ncbi:heavy-metal-associated domain-containing protein [Thermomonas sp.]|uniref:heavy-metal-associated domain-containing protein n=1 Tax=Thermomonas sp. TaxID=1971895 RepID=UPI00260C7D0D|nr:heavy-metal-associated domain-containing protein [Thermomonas sp.]MCO5055727.1 heavy-metal-associated domain-containing protein [Thermomonas sp.]